MGIEKIKEEVKEGIVKKFDVIADEKVKMSILEFQFELMDQLVDYARQMDEATKSPLNEEQEGLQNGQTFDEWMSSFRKWASF